MEPTIMSPQEKKRLRAESDARARSLTVGTAFGGAVEVTMRRNDASYTYAILQPVEAIEFIHQLAASAGCHIHITPRRDFAAWRNWQRTEEELAYFRGEQHLPGIGHPPHANDIGQFLELGARGMLNPEYLPNLNGPEDGKEPLAIEKPKKRSRAKRAADPS